MRKSKPKTYQTTVALLIILYVAECIIKHPHKYYIASADPAKIIPVEALNFSCPKEFSLPLKGKPLKTLPACIYFILFGLYQFLFRVLFLVSKGKNAIFVCSVVLHPLTKSQNTTMFRDINL